MTGYELILSALSLAMLATALWIADDRNLYRASMLYALQSGLLACLLAVMGIHVAGYLLIWAATAAITKVVGVPYMLAWLIRRTGVAFEEKPLLPSPVTWALAGLLAGLGFLAARGIGGVPYVPLSVSLALFGVGLLQVASRRSAVKQILGLCHFENGSHLTLALLAPDIPETVEIGIATDALLLVFFGCVVARLYHQMFGSLDTSQATMLREW